MINRKQLSEEKQENILAIKVLIHDKTLLVLYASLS